MGFNQASHQSSEEYYDPVSANGFEKNDVKCYNPSENFVGQEAAKKDLEEAWERLDFGVKKRSESEKENGIRTQVRSTRPPPPLVANSCGTSIGLSPYVLHSATSPPPTPSRRCKSPFVPSFKSVTKVLAFPSFLWAKVDAFIDRLTKCTKNADSVAEHFWDHVKLGGNVSETMWGKVSLGTKIVTEGGVENVFRLNFIVGPREKLVKSSSCYLSTSVGPIPGLLFISTEQLAFCSDRPLTFKSSNKKNACSYYRVAIPLGRALSVNEFENLDKPGEQYIQIQTVDNHEFWLMGFVNYKKAMKYLQRAVRSH
ncbi:hypothetical protein SUGI_0698500 [Cryptomeria japonica]|uniref:GEM-like protein 1 n=1 Tax=Cryptomeria japonica TaxID=3369 RepID=UPI0024148B23|nr:GEM-like protein 1 [Cryptomeria japonica]GLJ34708.1 hypothetical protein SUGI_0698500 [Cryptomeria japonica]